MVGHLRGARDTVQLYGVRLHLLMSIQVEAQNLIFAIGFSHRLFGLRGARCTGESHGVRLHQLMSTHVEAQNLNATIGFSHSVAG